MTVESSFNSQRVGVASIRNPVSENRVSPEGYPFVCEILTRFADLDRQNHVNNVAMGFLFEEARLRFHQQLFRPLEQFSDLTLVMVQANYAFRDETFYPDPVIVGLAVGQIGRTSFTYNMAMFQNGRHTSQCDATLVCLHGRTPSAISDGLRQALVAYRVFKKPGSP